MVYADPNIRLTPIGKNNNSVWNHITRAILIQLNELHILLPYMFWIIAL